MLKNITDRAHVVFLLAHEEVLRLGHEHIDTEHILLALVYEGGIPSRLLADMGIDMITIRREVNESVKYQYDPLRSKEMVLSPKVQAMLQHAAQEARQFGYTVISTEHLFLAIIQDGECTAAQILKKFGLDFSVLRQRTIEIITSLALHHSPSSPLKQVWFGDGKKKDKTFCTFEKQILCLLSHVPQMGIKEFLDMYQARTFSPQYIRNMLSKMKKEGYITSPERSVYTISAMGLHCLRSLDYKPLHYKKDWNHTWFVVAFEIPENQRTVRDSFRSDLIRLGFGMLHNGIYLSPWNYRNEVSELASQYDVLPQITMMDVNCLIKPITPEKAYSIWKLNTVAALYQEKLRWFRQEFLPSTQVLAAKANPLDLFIQYLNLGDHLSELSIIDPVLPKVLLPEDWPGEIVNDELGAALNQFIHRIANESYYGRFVK